MISIKLVPLNAPFAIRDNRDPDSIVTEESDLQPLKHLSPKYETIAGIVINRTPDLKNPNLSIRSNFDPFSNTFDLMCSSS
jgi:hypothetical protein